MSRWADTRPTVAGGLSYADRLKAAIKRSGISVREVAKRLADKTGNPLDDERSAIYRYMKKTEPEPDRAAFLAAILSAPELEEVTPMAEKRRGRQAELEAEVAQLRKEFDAFVAAATERMAALEVTPVQSTRQSGRPSSETQN